MHQQMGRHLYEWVKQGRPRQQTCQEFRDYKNAKRMFRAKLSSLSKEHEVQSYVELEEAAEMDQNLLWS